MFHSSHLSSCTDTLTGMQLMPSREHQSLKQFIVEFSSARTVLLIYARLLAWVFLELFRNIFASWIQTIPFLSTIIHLVLIYLILGVAFNIAAQSITYFYRRRNKQNEQYTDGFIIGITRLSRVLFFFTFGLFVVDVFVPIESLLGSITIAIAVTGLAFRDAVTNFVNGISIMFSGKFKYGEYVRIGQTQGRIIDLTFTHVHLRTESQDIVFVPNNMVLSQEVTNYSKNSAKNIFVPVVIDRLYYPHYNALQEHIKREAIHRFADDLIHIDSVTIHVESFEKESTSWRIEYHITRHDFILETALKNFTAEVIINFLAQRAT